MGEKRNVYRLLGRKARGKEPLGGPRHGWRDNIKMYILEVGLGVWTGLVWLRIDMGGELL
jgi:hypothetical protein